MQTGNQPNDSHRSTARPCIFRMHGNIEPQNQTGRPEYQANGSTSTKRQQSWFQAYKLPWPPTTPSWNLLFSSQQKCKNMRSYVDPCYATHTWEFLNGINCHIQISTNQWIQPQRKHDQYIMEDVVNIPRTKPDELAHSQRVRLFLTVTTRLAHIITSDRKSLIV
jgi:hypothetical protein